MASFFHFCDNAAFEEYHWHIGPLTILHDWLWGTWNVMFTLRRRTK